MLYNGGSLIKATKVYAGNEIYRSSIAFIPRSCYSASGRKTVLISDALPNYDFVIVDKNGKEVFVGKNEFDAKFIGADWYDGAYYVLMLERKQKNLVFTVLKINEDGKLVDSASTVDLGELSGFFKLYIIRPNLYNFFARFTTARGKPEFVVSAFMFDYFKRSETKLMYMFILTPDFDRKTVDVEILYNYKLDNKNVKKEYPNDVEIFVYRDTVYTFPIIIDGRERTIKLGINGINIFNKSSRQYYVDLFDADPQLKKARMLEYSEIRPYTHRGKLHIAVVVKAFFENPYDSENPYRTNAHIFVIKFDNKPSIVKHAVKDLENGLESPGRAFYVVFPETNDVAVGVRIASNKGNRVILEVEGTSNIMIPLHVRKEIGSEGLILDQCKNDLSKLKLIYKHKNVSETVFFDTFYIGSMAYKHVFY